MFQISGESSTLELASPFYVGGINPDRETFRLPPVIWSANLKLGYVGCMRDVVVDGRAIDVVDYAQKQDSGEKIFSTSEYDSAHYTVTLSLTEKKLSLAFQRF